MSVKKIVTAAVLAAFVVCLLYAADPGVKNFRRSWRHAQKSADAKMAATGGKDVTKDQRKWALREAREDLVKAETAALEKIAGTHSVKAAKAVLDEVFRNAKKGTTYDGRVFYTAYETLRTIGTDPKVTGYYADCMGKDRDWRILSILAKVLGEFGSRKNQTLGALHKALENKAWQVRLAALKSIVKIRDRSSIPALVEALAREKPGRFEGELHEALGNLTGQNFEDAEGWEQWIDEQDDDFALNPEKGAGQTKEKSGEKGFAGLSRKNRAYTGEFKGGLTTEGRNTIYGTIMSKRVVFIVDISNSMNIKGPWGKSREQMTRLEMVKRELCNVIDDQVEGDCKFTILTFHDFVFRWKKRHLVPGTESNKKSAKAFIMEQKATGHTNSLGALTLAFTYTEADTIYFLSDGYPTVGSTTIPDEILKRVAGRNTVGNLVIHTIAFLVGNPTSKSAIIEDKGAAADFMQKLAKENGGTHRLFN